MNVRLMAERDIPKVVAMGADMHAESQYRGMDYDPYVCHALAEAVIQDPNQIALVAETDGEVVGMISGYVAPFYFGSDLMAADRILYVMPEYRGSSAFIRLVKAFCEWATEEGARQVFISTSSDINTDQTDALFERMAFETVGAIHRMEVC